MSRRRRGLVLVALGGVPLAILALLFLPSKAGGSVHYVRTTGISMVPHLHEGDLVLVRGRSHYRVGDVAAYRSHALEGLVVLHRIRKIAGGAYTFRGDNNDYTDSPPAQRGDIVGAEWIVVRKAWVTPVEVGGLLLVLALSALLCSGIVLAVSRPASR